MIKTIFFLTQLKVRKSYGSKMGQPWKESFSRFPIILFLCDGKITNKYGISYSQNSAKYWVEVSPLKEVSY